MGSTLITKNVKAKKVTEAERLKHQCPQCFANPGTPCLDPAGLPCEKTHRVRGPGQYEATAQAKADRVNARTMASYGPLFQGVAEAEVKPITARDVIEERRLNAAFAPDAGGPIGMLLCDQANRGIEWLRIRHMVTRLAEIIGPELAQEGWDYCVRVYGPGKEGYYEEFLTDLATTRREVVLRYDRWFDFAKVKTICLGPNETVPFRIDGWMTTPAVTFPPANYTPPYTREQWKSLFPPIDHHRGLIDAIEPDDGGLFDRTIGSLKRGSGVAS